MSNDFEDALTEQLEEARQFRAVLRGHQGLQVSPEAAYRVQTALIAGQKVRGYKLERTEHGLICGPVYPSMIQSNAVKLDKFMQPRLEPEIGVIVQDALKPGSSAEEIQAAIWGFFLAVDIRDSVWEGHHASHSELIADGASGGGFVFSSHQWPQMPLGELRLLLNGAELARGPIADLGDPVASLQWLLGCVGFLPSGTMVFLGSPAEPVLAQKGKLEVVCASGVLEATLL